MQICASSMDDVDDDAEIFFYGAGAPCWYLAY